MQPHCYRGTMLLQEGIAVAQNLLNKTEVAELLGVASGTVVKWVRERRTPEIRIAGMTRRFDFHEVVMALKKGGAK